MSNQVSLIISMIFLAILLMFSGELISYQQIHAAFINDVGQIAHHLQVYGYDERYVDYVQLDYSMDSFECTYEVQYDTEIMKIKATKDYKSMMKMFSFMDSKMTYSATIYR